MALACVAAGGVAVANAAPAGAMAQAAANGAAAASSVATRRRCGRPGSGCGEVMSAERTG